MKILFVVQNMKIGGIQKALLNYIKYLSEDQSEITLLLLNKAGECLEEIPSTVKVIESGKITRIISKSNDEIIKNRSWLQLVIKSMLALLVKITSDHFVYGMLFRLEKIDGKYDFAVSFSQDNYVAIFAKGCNQYIGEFVKSDIKLAFLHSDITREIPNKDDMIKKYIPMDAIFNVSNSGKDNFDSIFPQFENKSYVSYNLFDTLGILNKSNEIIPYSKLSWQLTIVTVSRLCYLKGIDRILNAVLNFKKLGISNIKWYVLGDGIDEYSAVSLKKWVQENDVSDIVEFLGSKENPYPYIKLADVFIFPTRTEAFPMVTIESMILRTPVITCDYISAVEQIENKINGMIIENSDEGFEKMTKWLIESGEDSIKSWRSNLETYKYNNEKIFQEFINVINQLKRKKFNNNKLWCSNK